MYEAIIGLEVHAQLATRTKLFCACPLGDGGPANSRVCAVCLGHPGTLPTLNAAAVDLALRAATALGCEVHERSVFSRKQYFYPDLAKGYQISQHDRPLATGGVLHAMVDGGRRSWRLMRIQVEEDAGKSVHLRTHSGVDYNRAGTPLIEIVSEADLRGAPEAVAYLRMLHRILTDHGITSGDLEKGHFRCDANVSVHRPGTPWGTRVEVKNLNSFRFVGRAITHEIERQTRLIEAGGTVVQETRGWDGRATVRRRLKEGEADYRHFPDPDLPPLVISVGEREAARARFEGLPCDLWLLDGDLRRLEGFCSTHGLGEELGSVLLGVPEVTEFFEAAVAAGGDPRGLANWVQGEVLQRLNDGSSLSEAGLTPTSLVALAGLLAGGAISRPIARQVFQVLWDEGGEPATIVAERGLATVADDGELRAIVLEVIRGSDKQVAKYRAGQHGVVGYFIGAVMRATRGQADPAVARRVVVEELERA